MVAYLIIALLGAHAALGDDSIRPGWDVIGATLGLMSWIAGSAGRFTVSSGASKHLHISSNLECDVSDVQDLLRGVLGTQLNTVYMGMSENGVYPQF